MMPLPVDSGEIVRLAVFPFSVFAELHRVADPIASRTRWPEYDTALFVLTGQAPKESGIKFQIRPEWTADTADDVIVLAIDAWISPATVKNAYSRQQHAILGGRSRAHERSLELVRLAVESMEPGGSLPQPEPLMTLWNARYRDRAYKGLWRFRSHYAEAVQQILKPAERGREKRDWGRR
jgi:hypothetical protein